MSAHSRGESRSAPLPLPAPVVNDRDMMIYLQGSKTSYHCEVCGCNVFKQLSEDIYKCNGCGEKYTND